jgi:hypothetical protein
LPRRTIINDFLGGLKMARTTLDFTYNDKDYSLGYTIDVIKRLDRSGLLAQIANGEHPLTMTEDLFVAAFEAKHKDVSSNVRRKILKNSQKQARTAPCWNACLKW